jgi:pimeloyl-ACP methyl ester carboxylesterase
VELEVISREPTRARPGRPPLLFVHGLAGAAWIWAESWLDRAAGAGWSAHALSLRGHGGSAGREHRWRISLTDYVRDVQQVAALLPEPPVLVAHSLGSVVVGQVIARQPVPAVVMLVPVAVTHGLGTLTHNLPRIPGQLARMVAGRPLQLTADDILNVLAAQDPAQAQRYIARLDDEPPLPQYQLAFHVPPGPPVGSPPVLVYGAEQDHLVPDSDAVRTAAYYGTAVRVLPGTGHYVMLDAARNLVLDTVLEDLAAALDVDARPSR